MPLEKIGADRRSFVKRMLGMAPFAAPTVRSLLIGGAAGASVQPLLAIPPTTGTSTTAPPSTTVTTAPPSTTVSTAPPTTLSTAPPTTIGPTTTSGTSGSVPEIDATSAGAALGLLAGAVLIARDRRNTKPEGSNN